MNQPNERAAALRLALDIVRDQDELRSRVFAGITDPLRIREGQCAAHYLANLMDTLSDQLLDAGGFLGDEPEPEENDLTAYIISGGGEVLAYYLLQDNDPLDADHFAQHYATMAGFELDTDCGLIPDGCEDFSVKISNAPDDLRCWTSCNYMMKGF